MIVQYMFVCRLFYALACLKTWCVASVYLAGFVDAGDMFSVRSGRVIGSWRNVRERSQRLQQLSCRSVLFGK
jgi:hypothetical protein